MSTYSTLELVQNVFGEWVSPHPYVPPPCVSIPVTPYLQARDAAERAKRETFSDWTIKASLSERNLLGPKQRKPYTRTAPARQGAVREPRPRMEANGRPSCSCGMWVTWDAEGMPCWRCRRKAKASWRPCVGGCGNDITLRNIGDLCYRCRQKAGIRIGKKSGRAYIEASQVAA